MCCRVVIDWGKSMFVYDARGSFARNPSAAKAYLRLVLGWHLDSAAPFGDGHLFIHLALCHLRVHVLIIVPLQHNNNNNTYNINYIL